ncbi:N-acetylmuramoyl-L-alanine amidase [Avibacterium sp. 21-599]|uniref:N-acetylmuramoyl-L-alanine amidase n=1 Tax=Avibacterium sp. 21-599 TaxID=2911528 RepID=UPI002247F81F|nr:N-acetylmuramoyl-L-alanine amidase [Avibacterium sp. 21-599]MCW9718679.1 N-acetylmuramoyl-L-alanine amidase [Avibacterium sp. 21-599]
MNKNKTTEVKLKKDICEIKNIQLNDKAATRQAIINYIEKNLILGISNKFIERSEWNARKPKKELSDDWNYTDIVIHHQGNASFGTECVPVFEVAHSIQNEHMSGKFDDIGYHYIVACDGQIAEGRDIRFQGSHVNENNFHKVGILLTGDYSERGEVDWKKKKDKKEYLIDHLDFFYSSSIPKSQKYACIILIEALLSVFCIKQLGGHREFALSNDHRTCPGNVGMQFVTYLRQHFQLDAPEKGKINE